MSLTLRLGQYAGSVQPGRKMVLGRARTCSVPVEGSVQSSPGARPELPPEPPPAPPAPPMPLSTWEQLGDKRTLAVSAAVARAREVRWRRKEEVRMVRSRIGEP